MRCGPTIAGTAFLIASTALAEDGYQRLEGHGGPIKDIAMSVDGRFALTASFDNSVGLWPLGAQESEPLWLEGHEAAVTAVKFLPDKQRALSAGDDFDAILWDRGTGELLFRLEGHEGKILGLAITKDGDLAATASWDGRIGLWDLATGDNLAMLEGHRGPVQAVAFTADGQRLYSASSDGTLRLWDVAARAFKGIETSHGFGVNKLILNENAGWLGYGALDGGVRILDIETGREIADVTSGRQPVLALTLSPGGDLLAIGDGEGFIHIVSTDDWRTIRDFRATPRGPTWALAFDGDASHIVAGTLQNHADIWPIATAESVAENDAAPREFLRDPETMSNGERQFTRKCSICHTLTPDGGRRAGPSLNGVFGRRAGTLDGYSYSSALLDTDLVWSDETLDKLFDLGPDHYTPGSKMPMQRIARAEDRADLIDYLRKATAPDSSPEEPKE